MEPARGLRVQYDQYDDLFQRPGSEAFERLYNAEEYFMVPPSYLNDEVKKALRKTAVEIIESHCSSFDALIPYTAMTYFDRFLSRSANIPPVTASLGGRNTKLFVICCLTIAWKLRNKSFNLSSFLRERGLAHVYSTQDVLKMELQICRGLEWRMRTLTPFCFVEFFIQVLCQRLQANLPSPRRPVRDLIVRSQCDIAFTEFRPSVMAACATLIVSSKMFPDQHGVFDLRITTDVEPLRVVKDMLLKCNKQLTPLYRNPSIRKPRDITIPIDDPPAGSSSQTNPVAPLMGSVLGRPIPIPEPGTEPSTSESQPAAAASQEEAVGRRPGKEPASSETHLGPAEEDDDIDELMDFKLGWKELLEEAERRDWPPRRAWISRTWVELKLTNCWIMIETTWQNLKDNTAGCRCNIM